MQLLMGLNESYSIVRGHILMMRPLSSISEAYSLLVQEEKQREIGLDISYVPEAASMNARVPIFSSSQFNKNQSQGPFKNRVDYKKLFCEFCKRTGHTKERCFKLHVFPNKNNKGIRSAARTIADSLPTEIGHIPDLTTTQYSKVMDFLNESTFNLSVQHQNTEKLNEVGTVSFNSASVAMAGNNFFHNSKGSYIFSSNCKQNPVINTWIIDSKALIMCLEKIFFQTTHLPPTHF